MRRKLRFYMVFLLPVLFLGTGCRDFSTPFWGDKLVARVGDKELYQSEIGLLLPLGTTPEDSLALLEAYVDVWVKKQLKIQESERLFESSVPEIDRMVEEYRASLLGMRLDNHYASKNTDTTFTAAEIAGYYADNRNDFILDRDIVRGRIVKFPDNSRQKGRLRELIRGSGAEQYGDFKDICLKNGFEVREYDSWTDLSDFLSGLPASGRAIGGGEVQELHGNDDIWLVYVSDMKSKGDVQPLERVEGMITRILANRRRCETIRSYEDSLYRAAIANKSIVIKTE